MKDKILELVRSLGPIVPSEITSKLESNSVIVSALLSELIKEGELFYSHMKIGNSPLYFIKGQEDIVRKRLTPYLKITENKIIEFFQENKLVLKDSLSPQQRFMVDDLKDFITPLTLTINGQDRVFYKYYTISNQTIYDELSKKKIKPKPVEDKTGEQMRLFAPPVVEKKVAVPVKSEGFVENKTYDFFDDLSDRFFNQYNLNVLESRVVKKAREAEFVVVTTYRISQKYFVKYYKKKTLNENDVSKAYAESQLKKMPCILITSGKISKKGNEIMLSLGSLITLICL